MSSLVSVSVSTYGTFEDLESCPRDVLQLAPTTAAETHFDFQVSAS